MLQHKKIANWGGDVEKFGYLTLKRPWQELESRNITFADELDFDASELNIIFDEEIGVEK